MRNPLSQLSVHPATKFHRVKRPTRPPLGLDVKFTPPLDDSIAIARPTVRDVGPAYRGLLL